MAGEGIVTACGRARGAQAMLSMRCDDVRSGAGDGGLVSIVRSLDTPCARRMPLVLCLHGYAGSPESVLPRPQDAPGTLTCAPRGPRTCTPGGYAWSEVRFTRQGPIDDPDQVRASAAAVVRECADACAGWDARPDRVAVFGHSQGGMLALLVASLLRPAPVAVAIAGAMLPAGPLEPRVALAGVPVLLVRGVRDRVVPMDEHARMGDLLVAGGARVSERIVNGGHALQPKVVSTAVRWMHERICERP